MTLFPSATAAAPTDPSSAVAPQLAQGGVGTWVMNPATGEYGPPPAPAAAASSDNGPSIFGWHPSMPNLGGFKALGQLVQGALSIPEIVTHPNEWGPALGGIVSGLAGVASTITAPIGIPGVWNVGENVIEPAVDAVTGQKAQDFWQMSKHNGVLYGAINTVMNALPVTGPVAGALGGAADVAEAASAGAAFGDAAAAAADVGEGMEGPAVSAFGSDAAQAAVAKSEIIQEQGLLPHPIEGMGARGVLSRLDEGGDMQPLPEEAPSAYQERLKAIADAMRTKADIAHAVAHPFGALFHAIPELSAASFQKLTPGETETPEAPQSPSDIANSMTPNRSGEALTPADVEKAVSAGRSLEDPTEAAAQTMTQGGRAIRTPSTLEDINITPDQKAEARAEIQGAVDEARANVEVPGTGENTRVGDIEKKLSEPARPWAARLAEALPDPVNRILAQWQGPIDKFRINAVRRSLESWVEVSQRMTLQSPAVQEALDAGRELMSHATFEDGKITPFKASQMVGEELNARMRGTSWLAELIRSDGDHTLIDALKRMARGGYQGIPEAVWKQLDPATAYVLEKHLSDAEDAFHDMMQKRMQLLLASRPGSTGLEAAILGLDQPIMSQQDLADYRKARQYLRMQKYLESRQDTVRDPRLRELRNAVFDENKSREEADVLRNKADVSQRSMEDLRTAPPESETPRNMARIVATLKDELDVENGGSGGLTFDPGTGHIGFDDGTIVAVGVASQGKFTVAELSDPVQAEAIIRNAIDHPVKPDGTPYPPGIWAGRVKLGFWIGGDGLVAVDMSVTHDLAGNALSILQGDVLGAAFKQEATFVLASGDRVMPQEPTTQNLMAHYIEDTMNPDSALNRVLNQLTQTVAGSEFINNDDAFHALNAYARWDYALASTNPEYWKLGDIFNVADIDYGQLARGNLKYADDDAQLLGQTVMRMLPGTEVGAIESIEASKLSTALRWYYDSHDYIEGKYRYNPDGSEKMITLLNGEQRSAAEVFYDLIAVTSVQASPTQNFGRALMGLANMDDFLGSRVDALKNAQELMTQLEDMQPEMLDIVKPGTPEEHLAGPGEKGTALSNRFINSPAVRRLTEQTQMTNAPKYTVMDVLSGRLKLDSAVAGDLQHNAEWWGTSKTASADSMDRMAVVRELDRQGVHTQNTESYANWVAERNRLGTISEEIKRLVKDEAYKPAAAFKTHPEWVAEFRTESNFRTVLRGVKNEEDAFLEDPQINAAHDQALMEHQGSSLLAKLRSFRSNLSDPEHSLAVTLDSVMGRLWGFNSQQWDKVGFYAHYADWVRSIAEELSAKWGRTVAPHEVQAALWVYAKSEIGRQDWGRLLAHHDMAMDRIDSWAQGAEVLPEDRDLLGDYRNEEIGYSNEAVSIRGERQFLGKEEGTGYLTPEQEDQATQMRLDWLDYKRLNGLVARGQLTPNDEDWPEYERLRETVGEGRTTNITTVPTRADITVPGTSPYEHEIRYEMPYDANKLRAQMTRFEGGETLDENGNAVRTGGWKAVNEEVQTAIDNQDWDRARQLVTQWVVSQRGSILGSASGSSFGVTAEGQLIKGELGISPENSTYRATGRLAGAQVVPSPNDMSRTRFRMEALDELHRDGKLTDEQYETEAAKWRASLDTGEGPMLGQAMPVEPGFRRVYRGSDYAEPQGQAGLYWTVREPYGRNGYPHWQQTDLPASEVDRLKASVLDDRDRLDPWGTPVVGRDLILDPNNPLHQNAMNNAISFMHDTIDHGDIEELHQTFFNELRGALLDHPTMDNHLVMRMFKNAALDTLVHEGAHLLRRILDPERLKLLAEAYPHILDQDVEAGFGESVMNPAREAAEEKFVADLMQWIRSQTHPVQQTFARGYEGEGAMGSAFAATMHAEDIFRPIAAALEDEVPAMMGGVNGTAAFDVNAFWTRLFYPEIDKPDVMFDPIAAGVPAPKGVNVAKFPYESDPKFAQRARLYGEARVRYQAAEKLADAAERRAVQAETASKKLYILISTTPSELERQAALYGDKADIILGKLADKLDNPDISKVPMQWRPLWQSILDLKEEAKADRTGRIAELLQDVPQTFQAMLREAAARGFDPTFLPDMTWETAQRMLFGHIQLGANTMALDSTRRINQGILSKAGIANQSIEQLGAGLVAATKELYANTLIDHIEKYYTLPLAPGAAIPEGWTPWSAERSYIVTGTRPTGEVVQTGGASLIIPQHVADALDSMSQRYDHWTFHTLTRANSVWRTWTLTLSPRYYVHLFIANTVRAISYGVTPKDFMRTLRSWKEGTLPAELEGLDMQTAYHTLTHEDYSDRTMASVFQAPGWQEAQEAADTTKEHVQAAIDSAKASINRGHAVLDKFFRALIFEKDLDSHFSRDVALGHSLDVMGDYGDLSPIERSIVRSIMPFYPYYKGLLKLLAKFPGDHPAATVVLMQAGHIHQEYMEDLLHGPVPQSFATDFNIFGLRNYSILDPFQTAVNAIEPRTLAASLSPFVNILLSTAYNASQKGAMTTGMGPTGKKEALYDPFKALLQVGETIPPVLAAQGVLAATPAAGLLGGSNAYGQSPNLQTAVAKYAGIPQPVNAAATQASIHPTADQTAAKKVAGVAKAKATRAAKAAKVPKVKAPKVRKASVRTKAVRAPKAERIRVFKERKASLSVKGHQTRSVASRAPATRNGTAGREIRAHKPRVEAARNPVRLTAVPTRTLETSPRRRPKAERIAAFRLRKEAKRRTPQVGSAP